MSFLAALRGLFSTSTDSAPTRAIRDTDPRHRYVLLALIGAVVLAYAPIWRAGFIWDDDMHLTANTCIVGPDGLAGIWTSPAANYFPLVLTNFWLQHLVWGLNPLPYHLVNLAIHLACGFALWRVLTRLRVPGAWLGATLWTIHPVQVDSVAWISELKNTQSCLFFLLSVLAFLRWLDRDESSSEKKRHLPYAAALLCAIFAILSKSSTVMLPAVLGLIWWWQKRRWSWSNVIWLAPFLLISAVAGGWTIWEQKYHSGALGPAWDQTLPERFAISGRAVWFYFGKLLWPEPLTFIYPRWTISGTALIAQLPLAAVIAVGVAVWWRCDTWGRPLFFALGYFWLSLFPVLGFFAVFYFQYSFVADHFQYLASIGPLALAGAGLTWLAARLDLSLTLRAASSGLLIATLGLLTCLQSRDYQSDYTLWRTTLRDDPACWMAHNNLGNLIRGDGQIPEAIAHYEAALAAKPDFAMAHYNLAVALTLLGKKDEALPHLEAAVRHQPDYVEALVNLGGVYRQAGRIPEAARQYETALRKDPASVPAHYNLANLMLALSRWDDAITHYTATLRRQPDFVEAHNNLGIALFQSGHTPEAIAHFERALQLNPHFVRASENLAAARAALASQPAAVK